MRTTGRRPGATKERLQEETNTIVTDLNRFLTDQVGKPNQLFAIMPRISAAPIE